MAYVAALGTAVLHARDVRVSTPTLDLSVLRLLKDRKKYERYANMIPEGTVNKETAALLRHFGASRRVL